MVEVRGAGAAVAAAQPPGVDAGVGGVRQGRQRPPPLGGRCRRSLLSCARRACRAAAADRAVCQHAAALRSVCDTMRHAQAQLRVQAKDFVAACLGLSMQHCNSRLTVRHPNNVLCIMAVSL